MSQYFEIDRKKQLLLFKSTKQLSTHISEMINSIRNTGNNIDEELGKFLIKETPGPWKVWGGVRLALHNNAFNYGTGKLYYPSSFGPITGLINRYANSKIATMVVPTDLAAVGVSTLVQSLLKGSDAPPEIIQKAASAIGCAVAFGIKHGETAHVENAVTIAKKALDGGRHMAAVVGNSRDPRRNFTIDANANLIRFHKTDELAADINKIILELGTTIQGLPEVGPVLGTYFAANSPAKWKVELVGSFLNDNAFNYSKREFQSQGGMFALNRPVNVFVNYQLSDLLSVESILRKCIEVMLEKYYLSDIPVESVRESLVQAMSGPLFDLVMSKVT